MVMQHLPPPYTENRQSSPSDQPQDDSSTTDAEISLSEQDQDARMRNLLARIDRTPSKALKEVNDAINQSWEPWRAEQRWLLEQEMLQREQREHRIKHSRCPLIRRWLEDYSPCHPKLRSILLTTRLHHMERVNEWKAKREREIDFGCYMLQRNLILNGIVGDGGSENTNIKIWQLGAAKKLLDAPKLIWVRPRKRRFSLR
ncbi:hypothetical protein QBC38DRAFT_461868 [Podospora fimiseda]|uniref:Uncharacterized protein n=1 Tax=Podospora fimiseda TaxID=252190 RepID=A0AAN6YQQ8_9PEZI|nr:hypothetical protein QBC38DRAFT_461868 [Podospora fimiseda]